jgi:hypothetical protein
LVPGKGGEGPGTETKPVRLELNPAVGGSTRRKQVMAAKPKKKKMKK